MLAACLSMTPKRITKAPYSDKALNYPRTSQTEYVLAPFEDILYALRIIGKGNGLSLRKRLGSGLLALVM